MAAEKYLKHDGAGASQEVPANQTSAGAGDAGKIVALDPSGVLDSTIVNSTVMSAGSGDSGKLPALDGTGRIDASVLPVGIGADTAAITASEALSAGAFVNVFNSSGVAKVRNADATTPGKEAHGFVLAAVSSGATATVYFEGTNTQVTGQTAGRAFLQTTAGTAGATAPIGSGNIVQVIGFAVSATAINFQSEPPITLA
jgi:hypothetical protein